jgi:hypothetical protein
VQVPGTTTVVQSFSFFLHNTVTEIADFIKNGVLSLLVHRRKGTYWFSELFRLYVPGTSTVTSSLFIGH